MKMKKNSILIGYAALSITVAALFSSSSAVVGWCIILLSFLLCAETRKHRELLILMLILALVNISVGYYIGVLHGMYSPTWQRRRLLNAPVNLITLKSILVTTCILLLGMMANMSCYLTVQSHPNMERHSNSLIANGLIVLLCLILAMGFVKEFLLRDVGYSSVTNPIYEYSCILMVLMWFYSNKSRNVKIFVSAYTFLFLMIFLMVGDRSSVAIIATTALLLLLPEKLSVLRLFPAGVIALFCYNVIGLVRKHYDLTTLEIIKISLKRGFYIDTISWAYYASTAIASLYEFVPESWRFATGYLVNCLTGISTEYTGMADYAKNNFDWLYNEGGGIYSSFFYGMLGPVGTILGALLLLYVLHKIFTSSSPYGTIYRTLITALSFRWYLYGISTLYRGVLVITTILLLLCRWFDGICEKRKLKNEQVI